MKSNVVSVSIWGQEICKLEWRGGYKPGFGKLGAVVSFASGYASLPWDLDPLGFYSKTNYMVREGLSDWCRATQDEGIPRFISGSTEMLGKRFMPPPCMPCAAPCPITRMFSVIVGNWVYLRHRKNNCSAEWCSISLPEFVMTMIKTLLSSWEKAGCGAWLRPTMRPSR